MSNFEQMKELIAAMSGTGENVLAVNKSYLEFMGSLEGGVFLSQLIFFSDKSKRTDGYFYRQQQAKEKPEIIAFKGIKGVKEMLYELLNTGGNEHLTFGSTKESLILGGQWWISDSFVEPNVKCSFPPVFKSS